MNAEPKQKHTPGPWRYIVSGSLVGTNYSLAAKKARNWVNILHGNENHTSLTRATPDEARANARLMIAAPDLLAALRDLVDVMTGRMDGETVALHNALAALMKADG